MVPLGQPDGVPVRLRGRRAHRGPEAGERITGVVEGAATVSGALELAAAHGVEMPIAEQVRSVVFEQQPPLAAVAALMARSPKDELDD